MQSIPQSQAEQRYIVAHALLAPMIVAVGLNGIIYTIAAVKINAGVKAVVVSGSILCYSLLVAALFLASRCAFRQKPTVRVLLLRISLLIQIPLAAFTAYGFVQDFVLSLYYLVRS